MFLNGMASNGMDGSGTINPAELDTSVVAPPLLPPPDTPTINQDAETRGVKRARSSDSAGEAPADNAPENDESKPRKRGRPTKIKGEENSPVNSTADASVKAPSPTAQTPQVKTNNVSQASPTQQSPPKTTPTNKNIKSLPTARDHTTDQLNEEGDEYIPREQDDAGEEKVDDNGYLKGPREYRCRTFIVPARGDKLFMLATECARVLNYRDSYLLFNKNRSLYKIIASQHEKDDLIGQEVLPYSYRSRQIAIVTARSMYRQFGARMIVNGRRVRDDYWETKARKQGFTEEDIAGEKRPATTRTRDAVEPTTTNARAFNTLSRTEVVYRDDKNPPVFEDQFALASLPMINPSPLDTQRARQEMPGIPYQDRTTPNSTNEVINQAAQAADFNRQVGQQRAIRSKFINESWNREHKIDTTVANQPSPTGEADSLGQLPQQYRQSPSGRQPSMNDQSQQSSMNHQHRSSAQIMANMYQHPNQQNSIGQSPMHAMPPQQQMHQRAPSFPYDSGGGGHPPNMFGFQQNQMWASQGQQASPMSQHPHMPQYGHPQQPSPHPQQSPHHGHPQLPQHPQQPGGMQGNSMGFPGMPGMGGGYPGMQRNMYQPNPQQQFMHQGSGSPQAGMPGWAPSNTNMGHVQQGGWQSY